MNLFITKLCYRKVHYYKFDNKKHKNAIYYRNKHIKQYKFSYILEQQKYLLKILRIWNCWKRF